MRCLPFLLLLLLAVTCFAASPRIAEDYKQGHSHMGPAWDSGPRQKPVLRSDIGQARFPISVKNPEVQKWFDQGNALLHSFAYWDAERAFRWAQKLEPDNAMVYWGLARATSGDRAKDFTREAVRRKDKVTEREKLYIEALAAIVLPDVLKDAGDDSYDQGSSQAKKLLETLCVKYPDDVEARAMLALQSMGGDHYGTELIIREILAKQTDHPGAHHYRIHNWDYHEPEQALGSSRLYGSIVPGIGHALHMPGHIFSITGMWNEAAISMDAATRAEKLYMKDNLTFPFNNWNYGHNRFYLSYIQEQLGMPSAALFGARQLADAPKDPKDNNDNPNSSASYGIAGLTRAYLRFERWDDLLNPKSIPWRDELTRDKFNKAYAEARAWFGKGDVGKAEKAVAAHVALKADAEKEKGGRGADLYALQSIELKARVALAKGDVIQGLSILADAAKREFDMQKGYADPPVYPEVLYNTLGEEYLKARSPGLAVAAFGKALDLAKNDLFALSGLIRAHHAAGERDIAKRYMGQLMYVVRDAEPGLAIVERAKQTGISADPTPVVPGKERNYVRTSLEKFGPNKWEPYTAPQVDVRDKDGKAVSLADYKGKNVLLVFYLGEECPHCMIQLRTLGKQKDEWERLDTVLLAVSSALPKKNAEGVKAQGELPFRLLSDSDHTNARRFHSYDDFEEMELHSTILIDKKGRVYWARFGGEPFSDGAFLQKQLERMNELVRTEAGGSQPEKAVATASR
ncbi:MAG: redoxin domain-containing protein [Bryobacteraceae bacterium]|nr:redoxin domain-containing protein [Bryobacteraceae bacterium]